MQDQAPGDSRGDGWKGSRGPARARLTDLAEDYARLLASQDPAAAEATGLPSRALLPDVGPRPWRREAWSSAGCISSSAPSKRPGP